MYWCFSHRYNVSFNVFVNDTACTQVKQDWQFVSMVLDRLLFWLFTAVSLVGTFGIIIQAPTLYDDRHPIPA